MPRFFAGAQNDSRRNLKGVIEREKAALRALITLREPTKPMLAGAAAAGGDGAPREPTSPLHQGARAAFPFGQV
jgi:hypothetical protein